MENPLPLGMMNTVSDKFISEAMFCIHPAVVLSSTIITPAGLPLKDSSVKAFRPDEEKEFMNKHNPVNKHTPVTIIVKAFVFIFFVLVEHIMTQSKSYEQPYKKKSRPIA